MRVSILPILCLFLSIFSCKNTPNPAAVGEGKKEQPEKQTKGRFEIFPSFSSDFVATREVVVYLPESYLTDSAARFPVLYMQDGQNLFDAANAYTGVEWRVDEIVDSLTAVGDIRPCIVVGIRNTNETRFLEYMPQKPVESLGLAERTLFKAQAGSLPFSDQYLRFLVEEVKGFVDKNYRTASDQSNTFVAGASMGGLVSLYAVSKYPSVFSGAACFSTHWPIDLENRFPSVANELLDSMAEELPDPANHRLYFDFGTEKLDRFYEPYQLRMNAHLEKRGYEAGKTYWSHKFEGKDHSEGAWSERLYLPLGYLLGKNLE